MHMLATNLPVAQWLESATGDGRSWVHFPLGTQIFSLSHVFDILNIPCFLVSSPNLERTILVYLSSYKALSTLLTLILAVCRTHLTTHELFKYDLCAPRVSSSSVVLECPIGARKVT